MPVQPGVLDQTKARHGLAMKGESGGRKAPSRDWSGRSHSAPGIPVWDFARRRLDGFAIVRIQQAARELLAADDEFWAIEA